MNSFILKTEIQLEKARDRYKNFLSEASSRSFWQVHFENHNFAYQPEKFSWEYWREIPVFTKEDFLKIGLEKRIADIGVGGAEKPARGFAFRITSGTTRQTEPVLTIRGAGPPYKIPENEWRTIWMYNPCTLALRGVLINNACNERERTTRYQTLALDPYRLDESSRQALLEFHADNISAFPYAMSRFASFFAESDAKELPQLAKAYIGGDFLSDKEGRLIRSIFKKIELEISYGLAEFGNIGRPCRFLAGRYGRNAYHPRQSYLVELMDLDKNGIGEIVATNPVSPDFALIRYRTGDIGRAIREKCECGMQWTLILEGRKGFDIVKCGGAMVVRQELERVIGWLKDDIADWRAEAREILQGNRIMGELAVFVKPTPSFARKNINHASYLAEAIGGKLYVTPTETLKNLADSHRFMPLCIELVKDFPVDQKLVRLKKIN
ncbi:MAG: hypothetical protein A3C07_00855 [Candidatus Sungbacteria bacterium RIFCSPHIGHO2_02_FULL_47_11]|uniref:AMP-dependent synthetase/ligase domain-containing protein n=1 Tax=Candidatus Sungbacteria bacterium RIFCSPHIGHO2_02_FULL_47_11 TaxID=1802270 RepID=A0A1G2KNF4_9BACT|nr:MAG: hypothetical protein A3C07_00855 [Candidatus Sungbacteria bacterium RIFCSPHIGHO2_02_FULL_47_11]